MATGCDSEDDPSESLQLMFSDTKYKKCHELYEEADRAFSEGQLDTLEKLTLQYHVMKNAPVTINEVLKRRMDSLKYENRELRVYIAGAVGVGKTTFLNLLMGGDYLPTDHGSCTNILCEVHNNPVRLGVIHYEKGPPIDIILTEDGDTDEWQRIQSCIKTKQDNQINVSKVQIYWPLQIFKSVHETEVKEEIYGRNSSGSVHLSSDVYSSSGPRKGTLPVIFMDFPGVDSDDKELFQPYLQNIDKCHTFIFMIDIRRDHGVHGPTLQQLMSDIATTISMEITTLDPESALFVCTNCPTSVTKDTKKTTALIDKILNRIQMCWPMVVRSQIIFIDDMTQMKNDPSRFLGVQEEMVNFLMKAERLLLEEHCMWLTSLLECTSAYTKFGNQWKSVEDVHCIDVRLREFLEHLLSFHDSLTSNSAIIKEIRDIQVSYEDKIRRYLDHEIQVDKLTFTEVISLRDRVGPGLQSFVQACDKEIEDVLERVMKEFQEKFVFGKIQKVENRIGDTSVFGNVLILVLLAVFIWPVGLGMAIFAVSEFAASVMENDTISKQSLVRKVVAKLQENVNGKLDAILHEMNKQKEDLVHILNQNQKNKSSTVREHRLDLSEKFNGIAKNLWDVYVGLIMKHEFSSHEIKVDHSQGISRQNIRMNTYKATITSRKNEIFAVKEIQIKLQRQSIENSTKEKEDDTSSMLYDSSIFRERYLLKHLSMKKTDEDYPYFVRYEGSADRVDKGHYYLQLVMKMYKCSLLDVVLEGAQSIDQQRKIKYAKGAARGLRFLHKHRVMHRDVKLSNYLTMRTMWSFVMWVTQNT
ncbi:uncharacterized protein LOC125677478 isoform X2 [Ostrea edulis]|uniref:uncharacterized protein LOC125677478 isoform X2 n=1 Tax=Ostrea edulis TaxID=37623 RepID=UPI0024AF42B7|nr:uncharacterized protein LOC125677478 isoform X2 [Ostrea edulis]